MPYLIKPTVLLYSSTPARWKNIKSKLPQPDRATFAKRLAIRGIATDIFEIHNTRNTATRKSRIIAFVVIGPLRAVVAIINAGTLLYAFGFSLTQSNLTKRIQVRTIRSICTSILCRCACRDTPTGETRIIAFMVKSEFRAIIPKVGRSLSDNREC